MTIQKYTNINTEDVLKMLSEDNPHSSDLGKLILESLSSGNESLFAILLQHPYNPYQLSIKLSDIIKYEATFDKYCKVDKLLTIVFTAQNKKWDNEKNEYIVDNELLNIQNQLITKALDKGAEIDKLFNDNMLDVKIIYLHKEALLTHPTHSLSADIVFKTAFTTPINEAMVDAQLELVRTALNKGVDFSKALEKDRPHELATLLLFKDIFLTHSNNAVKDKFLELVIKSTFDAGLAGQQKKLIQEAIVVGSKYNGVVDELYLGLENLAALKEVLLTANIISIDHLLNMALQTDIQAERYVELVKTQYELVEFAIKQGADVNSELPGKISKVVPLELTENEEVINLLKNHGAKCGTHSNRTSSLIQQEGLYEYKLNLQKFSAQLSKNLAIEEYPINKIPYLVHHVWLTHSSKPNEISSDDIENVIQTKQMFEKDGGPWTHIVWTNDKTLIPNSVKILEENGIEVRSMQKFKYAIRLFDQINELINNKYWGMASDALRYNVVEHFGGVYADLNFEFKRSIESDIHKYDFFAQNFINNFFAAQPHHPIMSGLVEMVGHNLDSPPPYISNIEDTDIFSKTAYISLLPFGVSYLKFANKDGNVDIVYPPTEQGSHFDQESEWLNEKKCFQFWSIITFPERLDICGADHLLVGEDGYKGAHLTWMEVA